MVEFLKNNQNIEILTDTGWASFSGLSIKPKTTLLKVQLENTSIICTPDHKIFLKNYNTVQSKSLRVGDVVITKTGNQKVIAIKLTVADTTYDITDVSRNNRFYANSVLVSNCEFITADETLISAMILPTLSGTDPLEKMGQVRWFKRPRRGSTYIIALDPSLGTGGDNAAIQVLEIPSLVQVAEWQHNKTPIQQQVKILRELTQHIYECIGQENDIYYSLENNTLGEAALVAISEVGEENIRGIFLSDTSAGAGGKKRRKGFTVTNRSKLVACAKFKQLVESGKLTVSSKNLISELKNFIASGGSYAAKIGEKDDLVMSMLLAVRMTQALQNYNVDLDAVMRGGDDFDIMPMPFILI